jgi:hypothetical protein
MAGCIVDEGGADDEVIARWRSGLCDAASGFTGPEWCRWAEASGREVDVCLEVCSPRFRCRVSRLAAALARAACARTRLRSSTLCLRPSTMIIGAPWSRAYGAEDDPLGVSCALFCPDGGMFSRSKVGEFFGCGTTVDEPLAVTRQSRQLIQRMINKSSNTKAWSVVRTHVNHRRRLRQRGGQSRIRSRIILMIFTHSNYATWPSEARITSCRLRNRLYGPAVYEAKFAPTVEASVMEGPEPLADGWQTPDPGK